MKKRLVICVLALLAIVFALPAFAQEGMPGIDYEALGGEVVAEGLNTPLGAFIDAEGTLWLSDSGVGGDTEVEMVNPATNEVQTVTIGETSRVMRLVDGELEEIVTLPSMFLGADSTGAAHLYVENGVVYTPFGAWIIGAGEEVTVPYFGTVIRITDGEVESIADLWALELEENPDGTTNLEAHPYGITAGPDGLLYVTDAASNALYSIDPESGEIVTLAVFEGLPGVFPSPYRNDELITDPVPTGVVYDEETGNTYVALLSGAPFVPGSAKVLLVEPDGTVSDFATGLTMLTDMKMGPDGNLYVTQFGMFTEQGPQPGSGSVYRILPDGTSELVLTGLAFATALAIDADGNAYVVTDLFAPGTGTVIRFDGLTAMPLWKCPRWKRLLRAGKPRPAARGAVLEPPLQLRNWNKKGGVPVMGAPPFLRSHDEADGDDEQENPVETFHGGGRQAKRDARAEQRPADQANRHESR